MQEIGPCLWFDGNAEEAANFYVSVFRNSRILETTRYTEGMPLPAGTVLTVSFGRLPLRQHRRRRRMTGERL